jgi:hypothetical protein
MMMMMMLKDALIVHQSMINDDVDVHRNVLIVLAVKLVVENHHEIELKQDLLNK